MRCPMLLVGFFLIGGTVVPVKAFDTQPQKDCPYESGCQAMVKLMTAVSQISIKLDEQATCPGVNEKLDKQAEYQKNLKENLDRNLASTRVISEKLEKLSADLSRHDERLRAHFETPGAAGGAEKLLQSIYGANLGPRDCTHVRAMGYNVSGIYRVYPGSDTRRIDTDVYCDFSSWTDSWLVFQRRKDGSQNFERTWREYERGFGVLDGEFWLGNEKLFVLTTNGRYKLRVELEDFTGQKRYAEYSLFSVNSGTDKYRLTVGGYTGNAGDSLIGQSGMQFTTIDADNDAWTGNCAITYHGAWWHNMCHSSNLNGLYLGGTHTSFADGIEWNSWLGYYYSLKTTEMKIAAY